MALALRIVGAIQTHPTLRIALGLAVVAGGVVAVVIGAGHGGLIVVGILLVVGGASAVMSAPTKLPHRGLTRSPRYES